MARIASGSWAAAAKTWMGPHGAAASTRQASFPQPWTLAPAPAAAPTRTPTPAPTPTPTSTPTLTPALAPAAAETGTETGTAAGAWKV